MDHFDYPKMVETALRGVVREALARAQREGLRGAHHFTLSFQNRPEQLTVPFAAVASFADPSVNFALRFEVAAAKPADTPALPAKTPVEERVEPPRQAAEIVTLDKFRKR